MESKQNWWLARGRDIVDLLKRGFPFIVLIGGAFFSVAGMLKWFGNDQANHIAEKLGNLFFGSGLFTFMIKSFQYTGVFKEELTNIIFEPKFLKNRNDLAVYWERVSKELFKNNFPKISDRITQDVKDIYLPTKSVQYYDDMRHIIDIELKNPDLQIVKVKDTATVTLHPQEKSKEFPHSYRNIIKCEENDPHTTCKVLSFKVDGVELIGSKKIVCKQHWENGNYITNYEVTLDGKKPSYIVEKTIEKTYSLLDDNAIFNKNDFIRRNVVVQIFNKGGVSVDFYSLGTLNNFIKSVERPGYLEMKYEGLIYPKQGYLVILKKLL